MEMIFDVLSKPTIQKELQFLYSSSHHEYCRNGKISQEIGRSREDDIKSILHLYIGDRFQCNIESNLTHGADCLLNSPISIKHVGNSIGKGPIKAKWTSDETKAKAYINQMLLLDKKNYTHLLLIYIDTQKKHTLQIIGITDEQMKNAVEYLKESAFKTSFGTNTRGVEYSKKMIEMMLQNKYFQIDIENFHLSEGIGPIQRRQLLIQSIKEKTL